MNSASPLSKELPVYQLFRYAYQESGKLTADQIETLYDERVIFRDPVHCIEGLSALQRYFADIAGNVKYCYFDFLDELVCDDMAHVTWNMRFAHPNIAGGREQVLRGMSFVRFADGRICYHEDCYDLGAMIYEHLPVLGSVTRFLKRRLGRKR